MNAHKLPKVQYLADNDKLLIEQDGKVLHIDVKQLHKYVTQSSCITETPVLYKGTSKGETATTTRGEVFSTLYHLIKGVYGTLEKNNYLYMVVIDEENGKSYFGNWYVEGSNAKRLESDSPVFSSGSSSSFIGYIASPFGEILNTQDW